MQGQLKILICLVIRFPSPSERTARNIYFDILDTLANCYVNRRS